MNAYVINGPDKAGAGSAVATAAGAAAGTAVFPVVGTAIGAAIGKAIAGMFGGKASAWANAGPGVHDWFTAKGPQWFLDWMRKNAADQFGSLDQVLSYAPYACASEYNILVFPGMDFYRQGVTEKAYQAMGVDYAATMAANPTKNAKVTQWVMLPGAGSPAVPTAGVQQLKDSLANTAGQLSGAAVQALQDKIAQLEAANNATGNGGGGTPSWLIPAAALGAALLLAR